MHYLYLLPLIIFCGLSLRASEPDYSAYAELLETYATDTGVRYETWAANTEDIEKLSTFLDQAAGADLSAMTRDEQMAFYINLYNAAMLQAVFDHYPIQSVKDIGLIPFSIFKKKFIQLGDKRLSLDGVEKGILLKEYFDPRIHFAVNCASESCPPLRTEPYVGARLEAQLEEQTRLFAESERAAQVNRKEQSVAYSELLKWYSGDFDVDNPGAYFNRYRTSKLPLDYTVDWIKYDWSLNKTD